MEMLETLGIVVNYCDSLPISVVKSSEDSLSGCDMLEFLTPVSPLILKAPFVRKIRTKYILLLGRVVHLYILKCFFLY